MRYFALLLMIPALCAAAPVTQATLLDQGYRQLYDLQFADAHRSFQEWEREHPADPVGPASDAAAYLFTEFDRLHILQSEFFTHDQHFITDHRLTPDPALKEQFQAALEQARALSSRAPDDRNSEFASILASGLESDYLALIEKRYVPSLQEMKAGRAVAEKLLAADPTFYDAWLAHAPTLHATLLGALAARDLDRFGETAERSALAMHASAFAAGVVYVRGVTLDVLAAVRGMRARGVSAYATMDAGPHVKVLCSSTEAPAVGDVLRCVPGVARVLVARPGDGARALAAGEEVP